MIRPRVVLARWIALAVGMVALITSIFIVMVPATAGPRRPSPPSGFNSNELIFNETASGTSINSSRWNTFITSGGAQGSTWNTNGRGGSSPAALSPNYDAEYDLPRQVTEANGVIDIRATRTPTEGMLGGMSAMYPFASGVVCTYGKFEFTGGYVQIEAKMPSGAGIWPGLWMLPGSGATGTKAYEIDIFEGGADNGGAGTSPNDMYAWHLHTPTGVFGAITNSKINLTTSFNTYGLMWVPGKLIRWYLNGRLIGSLTSARAPIPDEPMDLIMNLQVATTAASRWHSVYNRKTPVTSDMLISGVQVYS